MPESIKKKIEEADEVEEDFLVSLLYFPFFFHVICIGTQPETRKLLQVCCRLVASLSSSRISGLFIQSRLTPSVTYNLPVWMVRCMGGRSADCMPDTYHHLDSPIYTHYIELLTGKLDRVIRNRHRQDKKENCIYWVGDLHIAYQILTITWIQVKLAFQPACQAAVYTIMSHCYTWHVYHLDSPQAPRAMLLCC